MKLSHRLPESNSWNESNIKLTSPNLKNGLRHANWNKPCGKGWIRRVWTQRCHETATQLNLRPRGANEGNETLVGLSLPPDFHPFYNTHHAVTHRVSRSQCVLGCRGLGQIPGFSLPGRLRRSSRRGGRGWPRSVCRGQSAAPPSTCLSRTTRAPWPARGSRGRKPPPRSSWRRTWGRRSASAGGRSSGWAGGSPSPARWWSWRFAGGGCSLLPWRCSPLTATAERHQSGFK